METAGKAQDYSATFHLETNDRQRWRHFGGCHGRIGQFLSLMKLPVKERRQYKEDGEVREYQLRALRCG